MRWAAERAPALRAQAEAEAVVLLRNALVAAATEESRRPEAKPAPPSPTAESEPGELLWAYCVLRASDPEPHDLPGVDGSGKVTREEAGGLAALVSRVPRADFGAEPLRRNLNDISWLEHVARSHEAVLERVLQSSTIVPLRMCTLYESSRGVRQMLEDEHDVLTGALEALEGRQEWGVKMLVDRPRLLEVARQNSDRASAMEDEIDAGGEGGAYMLRRRLEREVRELADSLAAEVTDQVHACLQDWAIDAVTRPAQNRELSGHEGDMLLNAAYLVDTDRSNELRSLVADLEQRHRGLGIRIELSGPWPPYNFVPGGRAPGA